jgi:hypothetical protein
MPSKKRQEELRDLLAPFSLSMLRDFVTFSTHCRRKLIDPSEIPEFIKQEIKERRVTIERGTARDKLLRKIIIKKSPKCSECGKTLVLEEINNDIRRMIDDHSQSWWVCPDLLCVFDPILKDETVFEILSDLGIPVGN